MFSFLHRQPNPATILTSKLYDERRFYGAFTSDLKHAKREVDKSPVAGDYTGHYSCYKAWLSQTMCWE